MTDPKFTFEEVKEISKSSTQENESININQIPDSYYDPDIRDKFLSLKGYLKK